jgi:hypothetical protein
MIYLNFVVRASCPLELYKLNAQQLTTGQIIIPYQFDNAYTFSEGLAKVTISGKEHLIDKTRI